MKTSQKGIDLIKKMEGIKLKAYQCSAGVWTIGYGHTSGVKSTDVITEDKAEELLNADLPKFEAKVNKYTPKYGWNQNEFDALVSFAFNIGSIDQLTAGGTRSRVTIAEKMLSYNKAGGKVVDGLTTRRKAERELFLNKDYSIKSTTNTTSNIESKSSDGLVKVVQDWLNNYYGTYIEQCESCGKKLLKTDGIFGSKTKSALTVALQVWLNNFYGISLKVNGVLDSKTKSVCKVISETVNAYTRGAQIVQAILYCYGYNPQLFAESFNKDCTTALKAYQKDHNLKQDGKAGVLFFTSSLG